MNESFGITKFGIATFDKVTLFNELFPSKGPDVAVFIGLVAFKIDTAVHPVFDPGVTLEIAVEETLYQKVMVFGFVFPPFLHCSKV
jgi:hypothetical protein